MLPETPTDSGAAVRFMAMATESSGILTAIWVKRARRGPMDLTQRVALVKGRGIVGNANQGGRRQVTLITEERWATACGALGAVVGPSARRANLLLRGVELAESAGQVLQIGRCRVQIQGETRPCERMDEARPGLRVALEPAWNGGAFAEVLDDGEIMVGDAVRWLEHA